MYSGSDLYQGRNSRFSHGYLSPGNRSGEVFKSRRRHGFEPDRDLLDRAKAVVNLEKGSPKVLEACMSAVRRGGIVSVLGVYASPYDNFPIGQFFDKGITIKGGQAPAQKHIDTLLKYVQEGKVQHFG